MKDRILKELNCVLDENTVGFFSFTVSKSKTGKIIPTVTWICDEGLPKQREKISTALFDLFDAIKPIFMANQSLDSDTKSSGDL